MSTIHSRRDVVTADTALTGGPFCRALSNATDEWLRALYADATDGFRHVDDVALLAVGGYGRRELAPFSDLDLVIVHRKVKGIDEIASRIWYPVWDAGVKLGHAVRTPKDSLRLCRDDLDTATSMVTARHLAGGERLAAQVIAESRESWGKRGGHWLRELHGRLVERQRNAGEVAFMLEPDLKEGLGGLRDVQAIWWAIAAGLDLAPGDTQMLVDGAEMLLGARVELHRHTGRPGDVLHLQDQSPVADAIGYSSSTALMAAIAQAGRQISWVADEAWARLDPPRGASPTPQPIAPGIAVVNGEIRLTGDVDPADDPTVVLRVATAAARRGLRIERASLNRLAERTPVWPSPWPAGASDDLVALLLEAEAAIPVLEALDQRNVLVKILPEWAPVRSKPQRNAYHRFTVDRHLWQAVANAAGLVHRVARPDLLVLGALFHDIGKGYPGDHTDVGVELFAVVGRRMGLPDDDIATITAMIRHHLLLADTATRRDLADDATIRQVADAVGNATVLDLLHALTEADSLATGPAAWGTWKAGLVDTLVARTAHVLGGGDPSEATWRLFPDAELLELMAGGAVAFRTGEARIAVVSPDRPGTFSRVAGVLALHNLEVLGAEAHSDEGHADGDSMAVSEFTVAPQPGSAGIDWEPVTANVRRALAGELPLEERIADRIRHLSQPAHRSAADVSAPSVRFDSDASSNATFVEVRAPDMVGLLHRVTKALAQCGLDIRHARVQTLGAEVVDAFYVRDDSGGKIPPDRFAEIEVAVLGALSGVAA